MNQQAPRRIAIVTDSTADLPQAIATQYDIHIVPQVLIMGDQTWEDGVDIDSATFYELLRTSPHFPSSSQPSIARFQELFESLAQTAAGIVAILVSDELSGTLDSARMAAENLPDFPIEIIDSRSVSLQLGFIALAAARVAAAGGDLEAVADTARALVNQASVYFVVDTLEYLHRGGRIGAAARLVGSALGLKPILEIQDGIVTPLTRVRTRQKALDKVFELLEDSLPNEGAIHMGVLHIAAPEEGARLEERVVSRFHPVELLSSECGPVIGTHAGPGTVGVAFYVEPT